MAVPTVARGAVPHPVLYHHRHAGDVQTAGVVLKSLDVRPHHAAGQRGILAERPVDAAPPRLRREIRLRRESHVDAHRSVLLSRHVPKAPHECRVTRGREAEWLRPLRKLSSGRTRAEHVLEVVARIGTDRDGNAEARPLGNLLQCVPLRGKRCGVAAHARDHARHLGAVNERARGRGVIRRAHADHARRSRDARRSVHHRARFLLERHARHEIAGASVGRPPPVFIWVEGAVPVQVPKSPTGRLDDRCTARAECGLRPGR